MELLDELSKGAPLPVAATDVVRRLAKASSVDAAVSFSAALAAEPANRTAGLLAGGVTAVHRRLPELALEFFDRVPAELRMHALDEYLEAVYRSRPEELRALLVDLLDAAGLGSNEMATLIKFGIVSREMDLAVQAFERLEGLTAESPEAWSEAQREIVWLRPWLSRRPAQPVTDDAIPFALIDYRQPGRAKSSQNIGDFVQTLASLGHIVRHQNVRFGGDPELAQFAESMRARVRPERRIDSPRRAVSLVTARRDATSLESYPEGTWMLAFGWYMHPLFGIRYDFPFHQNLRPIFISLHCNKREMLTPEAIAYLRRYGPIGCRDWTTVDLLLSVGVPAFFSGCLATTVDTVFPDGPPKMTRGTKYVDIPNAPADANQVRHSYPEVKERSFVENLRESVRLLDEYRTVNHIVTSRLHCYLPVRSLGVDATFQPKKPADVRFNGVIGIDEDEFDTMRQRILDRLSTVVDAILTDRPENEVYAVWRNACAGDVAAAQARHAAPVIMPKSRLNAAEIVRDAQDRTKTTGPEPQDNAIDVVVPVTASEIQRVVPTLRALVDLASRPVHVWLVARGCRVQQRRLLADQLPDVPTTWLPVGRYPRTAGLLLLPELMRERQKVVVVPVGAVVSGDIAELVETDLHGRPLAARSALGAFRASGFALLYRAAARMRAEVAHEYYRMIHARHEFDFDAFDTDVLVLDLAQLRKDDVAHEYLPFADFHGFSWCMALNLYAGPNRAPLPADWAHNPANEWPYEAKLIYWRGALKPWEPDYAPGQHLWESS